MTAGILDRPAVHSERSALDGSATLDELLSSALADVRANGSTDCPACHARMISTRAREARCGGCGSRLI
jgi:tRNA(Ile2) C34 agmatinyltransferase TiaS